MMNGILDISLRKVLAVCFFLACFSSTFADIYGDTIRLQLRWTHQFQFAGFYAAVENGYYKEEGLNVQLIEAGNNYDFAEMVLNGEAEFGVESTSLLITRNEGKPVVTLGALFQHSPEAFITLAKYDINSIEDFSGKTALFSMKELPSTSGIIAKKKLWNKVTPSSSNDRLKGLINGDHQIIDGYTIDMPYQIMEMGYHPVIISPINYGINFYGDCLFTTEDFLHKHPDKVDAFIRASFKGWKYAMNNKKEIVDLIINKYNNQLNEEELMYEARELEELIQPQFVEIGYMHKARWQHIAEVYVSLGLLKKDFSLDGFLYTDYKKKQEQKQKNLMTIVSIFTILLIGTLAVVSIFNRKLKTEVVKQTKAIRKSNIQLREEISERKLINENLIRTTRELNNAKIKAEESDKLKSAFLSNMSHEIRTPMNGIIGFSELLKQQDITPGEREKYTMIIEENSTQLLRIISDIIDISKIEIGEISINKEPIHIQKLFENLFLNFSLKAKQIKDDKVEIRYEIGENVPKTINTDPDRLKQVLSNLVENAIKFTEEGSIVYSIEKDQFNYVFKVRDTGLGISEEKLQQVFIRFFKDSKQHFSEMGGTGLGLSIAKNFVELLGGNINVTSQVGKGTEFTFTHPAN